MSKPQIGFIGLGIMGQPMAGNILQAGYPLTVYNRTLAKTEELASRGAGVAESPAQVATASEIIITIVSDSPDVEAVVAGPKGILEGIRPGSLMVDMSTISPEVERSLDEKLRARECTLLDAPVSGGDVGAKKGTLAIMVGGEREAFERARPLLEVMGQSITHCGPVGCGQLTKLCNQILVSGNLLAVSEALAFARKSGLDTGIMVDAVKGGAAGSWQLSNLAPRIVGRDFSPGFMVDLVQKDLRIILAMAESVGATLPATALVHQLFRSSQVQGDGSQGTQSLAKVLERLSGLEE